MSGLSNEGIPMATNSRVLELYKMSGLSNKILCWMIYKMSVYQTSCNCFSNVCTLCKMSGMSNNEIDGYKVTQVLELCKMFGLSNFIKLISHVEYVVWNYVKCLVFQTMKKFGRGVILITPHV